MRRLEHRLDARLARPAAHHIRRGAPAAQERHRLDEERLSGAGLAGEHVEPRPEIDLDVVEQRKIGDAEVRQHVWLIGPGPKKLLTIARPNAASGAAHRSSCPPGDTSTAAATPATARSRRP